MSSFMSKFFSGGQAPAVTKPLLTLRNNNKPSASSATIAANMHYSLCHWRTHTDIRPSCNIILIHDWLSTNASWSPLVGAMQRQPQPTTEQELMLQQPLSLFCPDLPNHGKSPKLSMKASNKDDSSVLEAYAESVLEFAQRVVPQGKIHLVGFGKGGSQIALLTSAALNPERFGSFAAILGGQTMNSNKYQMQKPLLLLDDKIESLLEAQDLSSLNQVDAFFAKNLAKDGMSDIMRFNTGTSHCGATKWEEGTNLKGTPSLQAKATKVRINSNVEVLRSTEDFGMTVDKKVVSMFSDDGSSSASSPINSEVKDYYKKELSSKAFVIQDESNINDDPTMKMIRGVFGGDLSVLQVPNTTFEGLATGARGPTNQDAENIVVPFLSLYQDHTDYAAMAQQQQQQQ